MNSQQRFCSKCGKPLSEGQSFCGACGAQIHEDSRSQFYTPNTTNTQPTYTAPQTSVSPRKRKTYTAQKFISMGFGIGDLVFAFSFWLCGLIFADASYLYDYSLDFEDYYSSTDMMSEMFDVMAGAMYFLAAVLLIGSIVAWIMFFVYSKKRREVMAQIELEKQQEQAQSNTWNQM